MFSSITNRIEKMLGPWENDGWQLVVAINHSPVGDRWIVRIEELTKEGRVVATVAFGSGDSLDKALADVEAIVAEKSKEVVNSQGP